MAVAPGASWLVSPVGTYEQFTGADFTETDLLLAKTAEDFVRGEVQPRLDEIEAKAEGVMPALLKRAGELELNLPESSTARAPAPGAAEETASLVLTEKGTLMLDGAPVTFESLAASLSALRARRPDAQITIDAETGVPHGQVVRLLDAVRTAGFHGVGIGATSKELAGAPRR